MTHGEKFQVSTQKYQPFTAPTIPFAKLFCRKEELGKLLCRAALNPIEPVVSEEKAPCQEVIHKVTDPDFDLFNMMDIIRLEVL